MRAVPAACKSQPVALPVEPVLHITMPAPLAYGFVPFRLIPDQRLLTAGDSPLKLGGRAFETLVALIERRDRTVSKHELLDAVWPRLVVEEANLHVQIGTLRKLLGHQAIATVPGRGYRFTLPVVVEGAALREPASVVAAPVVPATAPSRCAMLPPRRLPSDRRRSARTHRRRHPRFARRPVFEYLERPRPGAGRQETRLRRVGGNRGRGGASPRCRPARLPRTAQRPVSAR